MYYNILTPFFVSYIKGTLDLSVQYAYFSISDIIFTIYRTNLIYVKIKYDKSNIYEIWILNFEISVL